MRRSRGILGEDITAVINVCTDRGFFCPELPIEGFSQLAEKRKMVGRQSAEFLRLVNEVEGEVEGWIRAWLGSVNERRSRSEELVSYKEQLLVLERSWRLRHMQARRKDP